MKKIIFNLLITSIISVFNLYSQESKINSETFMCSVGHVNDSLYPLKTVQFKYSEIDNIKTLSNGKRVPLFFKLKSDIKPSERWALINNKDTTFLRNVEILAKGDSNASFVAIGEKFSESIDIDDFILTMKSDLIIFKNIKNKQWKLARVE